MNREIFDRFIKVVSGAAAAVLAIPFFAFNVFADSYYGISIDGDFSDWNGVIKHDIDVSYYGQNPMNSCAMVWDGDYIYIYLDEKQQNSASWSGPNGNGNFCIMNQSGEVLLVSVHNNGNSGNIVEVTNPVKDTHLSNTNGGLQVAHNSDYTTWEAPSLTEIRIPSSILYDDTGSITFGYYDGWNCTPLVSDVVNASPITGGHTDPDDPDSPTATPSPVPTNNGSDIVIDGDYYDWKNYPVSVVQYDTPGTNNNYADAKGSIYTEDGIAYVHCFTNYWDGSDTGYKRGAEFLEVTVLFDYTHTKLIAVDLGDDGSLSWPSSDTRSLPDGTHHYALFYFSDSRQSTNMDNINPQDHYLGEMYITVGKDNLHDETEFWFDVGALQKCGNIDPSFNGKIQVLFHRVGWRLFPTSGVSTGPIFVAALSTIAAGSYFTLNRRKKGR